MALSRLKRLLGVGIRKEMQDKLEKLGISAISDDRVMRRLELYQEFQEYVKKATNLPRDLTPEEKLDLLIEHIHNINNLVNTIAVPWGRAGSDNWYALMMSGWSIIYTHFLEIANTVKNIFFRLERESEEKIRRKKQKEDEESAYSEVPPKIQKEELVRKVLFVFQTFFLRYATLIVEVSWKAEDVAPSWSVTLQQPQVMPYGMPPIRTYDTGSIKEKEEESRSIQPQPPPVDYSQIPDVLKRRREDKT
jgi:hypothetical protein